MSSGIDSLIFGLVGGIVSIALKSLLDTWLEGRKSQLRQAEVVQKEAIVMRYKSFFDTATEISGLWTDLELARAQLVKQKTGTHKEREEYGQRLVHLNDKVDVLSAVATGKRCWLPKKVAQILKDYLGLVQGAMESIANEDGDDVSKNHQGIDAAILQLEDQLRLHIWGEAGEPIPFPSPVLDKGVDRAQIGGRRKAEP